MKKPKEEMTEKVLLITGGCGFIGTSLVEYILKTGLFENIRILDNFQEGTPDDLREVANFVTKKPDDCIGTSGIVLVEGDIRDIDTVDLVCSGVDAIVHLAANTGVPDSVANPRLDMENNVVGTFNVLESARTNNITKFVFASSGAPAGIVDPPIHEELPAHPVSPYGSSKMAGEGYCSSYYQSYGINTICLRFGNVFGPRSKNKSSVVAKFIRNAINGELCEIYGDRAQTRDFVYISDLVRAISLSLEKEIGGETFQIAAGKERAVLELTDIISKSLARYDIKLKVKSTQERLGDVKRNYSDTSKAQNILEWSYEVALESGIDRTVDYFMGELRNS